MIAVFFTTPYFFIASILEGLFTTKKNKLSFSGRDLFYKLSFRVLNKDKTDILFSLRCIKRMISRIIQKSSDGYMVLGESKEAIVDASFYSQKLRIEYIEKLDKPIGLFVAKNELSLGNSITEKIALLFLLAFISPFIFILSLLDSQKQRWPMITEELFESLTLQWILLKNNIKRVHYFCIYEKDANINAYLLMQKGIRINKIPSEVPLHFFNKVIVSDELSFCFKYQEEEFKHFSESMFVDETRLWLPEQIFRAPLRLWDMDLAMKTDYDIGFFSSGNWLRILKGDIDMGQKDRENEELLLAELLKICKNRSLKLRIFLHPLEKRPEFKIAVNDYYRNYLSESISIAEPSNPSIQGFDTINIGVSLYSTLMFERVVLGFKTIIAPWGYEGFPISTSSFTNICSVTPDDLENKIISNLNSTTLEFFKSNRLGGYSMFSRSDFAAIAPVLTSSQNL